uniref:ARAD1C18172p n=1 Tax=Blastobotrys adeninivorans TaxID=409370 RepID=A0A060T1R7_BLAAD
MSQSPPSQQGTQKPKSILRNSSVSEYSPELSTGSYEALDREKVLENTRANAKLHDVGSAIMNHTSPQQRVNGAAPEHLKWDEANIYLNEQEKSATMKISEPKTPYQGAVGESEYYQPDEEEDAVETRDGKKLVVDELDDFSLGESQYTSLPDRTVQNDRIERVGGDDEQEDEQEEEEEPELTPEEKHRRFEEMRKAHYHMKGSVLKHPVPPEDEDEDEEDENDKR